MNKPNKFNSYHPLGIYKLICAVFGEKETPEVTIKWLKEFTIEKSNVVMNVLSTLTKREERILILRFGLTDADDLTLQSIGDEFDLTRERIRQIKNKALRKLRHPTRIRELEPIFNEIYPEEQIIMPKITDGEPFEVSHGGKESAEFIQKCCDCGLEHRIKITRGKKNFVLRFWRIKKKHKNADSLMESLSSILLDEKIPLDIRNSATGEILIPANKKITKTLLHKVASNSDHIEIDPSPIRIKIMGIIDEHKK